MRKHYQNEEIDTSQPAVPDTVSVALAELAGELREGLLALAVGTGMQVMAAILEEDVTAKCGPKGRHDAERVAVRHGHGAGSVSLGGRRVPVARPWMRAVDGSGELPVPSYELFFDTEVLGRMALDRMLAGLSTRRYPVALEPVGTRTEQAARSTSKSAVSRRFVAQTETALAELLAADLSGLDLVALMVDGVHFGDHTCVVALGIDIEGTKHPLSLVEGSTENATLVTDLIVGLREWGLDVTRPILGGDRRIQGTAPRGTRRVRPAGNWSLSTSQDSQCAGPVARQAALGRRDPDAPGLPRRLRTGRRGPTVRAGHRTRPHPPRCRDQLARGHGRDPDRAAAWHLTHAGHNPALNQRHRVNDLDLSRPRQQHQALTRRADGAALVRRRNGQGRQSNSAESTATYT